MEKARKRIGMSLILIEMALDIFKYCGVNFDLAFPVGAIQGSFANCNISVDLDLFNEGIIEYI